MAPTQREGGRRRRKGRENCQWFPANALLVHKVTCLVQKSSEPGMWREEDSVCALRRRWSHRRWWDVLFHLCPSTRLSQWVFIVDMVLGYSPWDELLLLGRGHLAPQHPGLLQKRRKGKMFISPMPSPRVESALSPSTLRTSCRLPLGT